MTLRSRPNPADMPWRALALIACVSGLSQATMAQAHPPDATARGQALPRYVSLKPNRVNLRSGPGTEYPTVWIYKREGLPLEIVKEFEGWRQVRDADGASGWVLQSLLSSRRTALIDPWDAKAGAVPPQIALYVSESDSGGIVANIEAGAIANVLSCNGNWCWVTLDRFKGYIQQKKLWGVYEAEIIK